jgi:hypothetical protein
MKLLRLDASNRVWFSKGLCQLVADEALNYLMLCILMLEQESVKRFVVITLRFLRR